MSEVRVRFAPSPTGYLHVGGARTALFNWLFARGRKGVFVLRIEDTDFARSTPQAAQVILSALKFLGLDWDEGPEKGGRFGPYYQSQRLQIYGKYARELLAQGRAYECFCSAEELEKRRQEQIKQGRPTRYDQLCLHLSEKEKAARRAAGCPAALRFRAQGAGQTKVDDLIRGEVVFANKQVDDFVIYKSDGTPTYNFAVVVDDALMKISHVIRGEDHLSNTPKQMQIYEALGFETPRFAHIPMILGPDKALLSKRHGATSVLQFSEEGYLPQAMVNYLALLGWGYDDTQTVFSVEELVEKFSLERVSKNPAVFDLPKLEWLNGVYIRQLSLGEFYEKALPFWQRVGFVSPEVTPFERDLALGILKELQSRVKLLKEVVPQGYYFFRDCEYDRTAVENILSKPQTEEILKYIAQVVAEVPELNEEHLKPLFKEGLRKFGVKMGGLIQPLRVALTGGAVSPGIYEVLELLGREKILERIAKALQMLKERK